MKALLIISFVVGCSIPVDHGPALPGRGDAGDDVPVDIKPDVRPDVVFSEAVPQPDAASCDITCPDSVTAVHICKEGDHTLQDRCGRDCLLCRGMPAADILCLHWPQTSCVVTCGICR